MLKKNALGIFTAVLLLQAALFYSASHGDSTSLAAPLSVFPQQFGDFKMVQESQVEPEVLEVLKADDTLSRIYSDHAGIASLFIAYFKTQRQGQSPHSPKNCLPGSGFQPVENGRIDVPIGNETIHINRYLVAKGENESLVMYWYQSQGRVIADEFAAKFYLIADSIRRHRSDTALVRIVVPVPNGAAGRAAANKTAMDFLHAAYPQVKAFLPK